MLRGGKKRSNYVDYDSFSSTVVARVSFTFSYTSQALISCYSLFLSIFLTSIVVYVRNFFSKENYKYLLSNFLFPSYRTWCHYWTQYVCKVESNCIELYNKNSFFKFNQTFSTRDDVSSLHSKMNLNLNFTSVVLFYQYGICVGGRKFSSIELLFSIHWRKEEEEEKKEAKETPLNWTTIISSEYLNKFLIPFHA